MNAYITTVEFKELELKARGFDIFEKIHNLQEQLKTLDSEKAAILGELKRIEDYKQTDQFKQEKENLQQNIKSDQDQDTKDKDSKPVKK